MVEDKAINSNNNTTKSSLRRFIIGKKVNNVIAPNQSTDDESTWSEVASIISTVAWSVSFYGQVYENWKYKSVEGFSLNYLYLNIIGYTFYGIYSTFGFFLPDTKGAGTVLLGDLIFVYHAIPIVIVEAIQCCYYPRGSNKLSSWAKYLGIGLIVFVGLEFLLTEFGALQWTEFWNPISALGYSKLVISFVKYSPAVYWNWKRKSTKGWSIFNIILDLVGGTFSLASGSVSLQNGLNVTKLILAILTVVYDIIFVIQHYVLYKGNDEKSQKLVQDLVSVEDHVEGINKTEAETDHDKDQNGIQTEKE